MVDPTEAPPQSKTLHVRINGMPVRLAAEAVPSALHRVIDQLLATGVQHPGIAALTSAMRMPLIMLLPVMRHLIGDPATQADLQQTPYAAIPPMPKLPRHTDSLGFLAHYLTEMVVAVLFSGEWHVEIVPDETDPTIMRLRPLAWSVLGGEPRPLTEGSGTPPAGETTTGEMTDA